MSYVRVVQNTVVEILQPVVGVPFNQLFHPDLVAQIEYADDQVRCGWVKQQDGTFIDPVAPIVEEVVAEEVVAPTEPAPG